MCGVNSPKMPVRIGNKLCELSITAESFAIIDRLTALGAGSSPWVFKSWLLFIFPGFYWNLILLWSFFSYRLRHTTGAGEWRRHGVDHGLEWSCILSLQWRLHYRTLPFCFCADLSGQWSLVWIATILWWVNWSVPYTCSWFCNCWGIMQWSCKYHF